MRASLLWFALLLCWAAGSTVCAQEAAAPKGNWFTRLFRKAPPKEAPAKDAPPKVADAAAAVDPKKDKKDQAEAPVVQSPGAQRAQAQAILMRREEACLKFREIAAQTGDDELQRKAELLNQRAWEAYLRQVGGVPGTRGNLSQEEMVLESRLGTGTNSARTPAEGTRSGAQASRRRPAGEN